MPVICIIGRCKPGRSGELVFRADIYQKMARLQKALDQPLGIAGLVLKFNALDADESESGPLQLTFRFRWPGQ